MNSDPIRVLLVEDNDLDAAVVERHLRRSTHTYGVTRVKRLTDAITAATEAEFDVVLLDLTLPDAGELDGVRAIRAARPGLALVVLTGIESDQIEIDAVREGSQDFLNKNGLSAELLVRAVQHAIERQRVLDENQRLIAEQQKYERKLRRRNRRLRQLVETAQRFVDDVSHEFRTPLTVVTEYASLLREGALGDVNEEQVRFLDVIGDRMGDLATMVDDMLDSSRLQAGLLGLERRPCTIAAILDHVWPALERKAAVKEVELVRDLPDDLPDVFGDSEKIGRIVTNLVVNAIKFTGDPGRVRVTAGTCDEGREVWIRVEDNGPGMSENELRVVFERFRQLGARTRSSTKGFGLGLSIVRELVDLNLGTMDVDSEPGRGSTFSFSLPVNDAVHVTERYVERHVRETKRGRTLSLVTATIEAPNSPETANELDAFWRFVQRRDELRFRLDEDRWLMVLPVDETKLAGEVQHLLKSHREINRNRAGGPLPEPRFLRHGSWRVPEEGERLSAAVGRAGANTTTDNTETDHVRRRYDTSPSAGRRRRLRHSDDCHGATADGGLLDARGG